MNHRWWGVVAVRGGLGLLALAFVVLFPGDTPAGNSQSNKILGMVKDVLFNYVAWEVEAIGAKLSQTHGGLAAYLDERARTAFVVDYLKRVADYQTVEQSLARLYSDPTVSDPDAASVELRAERDKLRATLDELQPLAEAIIETQVATVLREEGFSVLGEIIPPVSAHLTRPPLLLVVSPRDHIQYSFATNITNLSAAEMSAAEGRIDAALDVSSLIVPIGGIGLYPTMVMETWHAFNLFDTVAHEWSHNYLMAFPLGWGYFANPEARIINETTATLFGDEIGRKVIERYYREYPAIMGQVPPLVTPTPTPDEGAAPRPTPRPRSVPPPFDGAAELHYTRIMTDGLLKLGLVAHAERFMERQRRLFVANGYQIRKLNQAFFAFYGGYQGPAGSNAGGGDPIGPAVQDLRRAHPTLKSWLEVMRGLTTRTDLLALRDQAAAP
jgi:hypothetical protein